MKQKLARKFSEILFKQAEKSAEGKKRKIFLGIQSVPKELK
ncbi:hypothetical protein [Paenibacillus sp. KS-LC4]